MLLERLKKVAWPVLVGICHRLSPQSQRNLCVLSWEAASGKEKEEAGREVQEIISHWAKILTEVAPRATR